MPLVDEKSKDRIRGAIEERVQNIPHDYGEPLQKTLKGCWKLRVGEYRAAFKVVETEVWILGIRRRKSVYADIGKRTERQVFARRLFISDALLQAVKIRTGILLKNRQTESAA